MFPADFTDHWAFFSSSSGNFTSHYTKSYLVGFVLGLGIFARTGTISFFSS